MRAAPRIAAVPATLTPQVCLGYERGWRKGAIFIRQSEANELRKRASEAHSLGLLDEALSLHARAAQHDRVAEQRLNEIRQMGEVS